MRQSPSDIAFTPAVKAVQAAKVAPAVAVLVEGAIVSAVIQGKPDAADVARDAALKLVAEEKGV